MTGMRRGVDSVFRQADNLYDSAIPVIDNCRNMLAALERVNPEAWTEEKSTLSAHLQCCVEAYRAIETAIVAQRLDLLESGIDAAQVATRDVQEATNELCKKLGLGQDWS
jgi:hypothetical protein